MLGPTPPYNDHQALAALLAASKPICLSVDAFRIDLEMRRGEQQKLLRGYGRPTRPGSGRTTIPLSPSPLRISHHDITSRQSAVNIQIPEFSGNTRQYEPPNTKDLQKCTPNFGKPYINPMQPGRWATSKVRQRPAASRSQFGGFVKFAESISLELALVQATQLLVELQCQARNACITKTQDSRSKVRNTVLQQLP